MSEQREQADPSGADGGSHGCDQVRSFPRGCRGDILGLCVLIQFNRGEDAAKAFEIIRQLSVGAYSFHTLTDSEREAVAAAIKSLLDDPYAGAPISPHADTLRNLLERMK